MSSPETGKIPSFLCSVLCSYVFLLLQDAHKCNALDAQIGTSCEFCARDSIIYCIRGANKTTRGRSITIAMVIDFLLAARGGLTF